VLEPCRRPISADAPLTPHRDASAAYSASHLPKPADRHTHIIHTRTADEAVRQKKRCYRGWD